MITYRALAARAWRMALPRLADRDSALLSMLALGLTQKEIADQWRVTPQLVSRMTVRAQRKLRVIIVEIVERGCVGGYSVD